MERLPNGSNGRPAPNEENGREAQRETSTESQANTAEAAEEALHADRFRPENSATSTGAASLTSADAGQTGSESAANMGTPSLESSATGGMGRTLLLTEVDRQALAEWLGPPSKPISTAERFRDVLNEVRQTYGLPDWPEDDFRNAEATLSNLAKHLVQTPNDTLHADPVRTAFDAHLVSLLSAADVAMLQNLSELPPRWSGPACAQLLSAALRDRKRLPRTVMVDEPMDGWALRLAVQARRSDNAAGFVLTAPEHSFLAIAPTTLPPYLQPVVSGAMLRWSLQASVPGAQAIIRIADPTQPVAAGGIPVYYVWISDHPQTPFVVAHKPCHHRLQLEGASGRPEFFDLPPGLLRLPNTSKPSEPKLDDIQRLLGQADFRPLSDTPHECPEHRILRLSNVLGVHNPALSPKPGHDPSAHLTGQLAIALPFFQEHRALDDVALLGKLAGVPPMGLVRPRSGGGTGINIPAYEVPAAERPRRVLSNLVAPAPPAPSEPAAPLSEADARHRAKMEALLKKIKAKGVDRKAKDTRRAPRDH